MERTGVPVLARMDSVQIGGRGGGSVLDVDDVEVGTGDDCRFVIPKNNTGMWVVCHEARVMKATQPASGRDWQETESANALQACNGPFIRL